jgi:hypothetical protein
LTPLPVTMDWSGVDPGGTDEHLERAAAARQKYADRQKPYGRGVHLRGTRPYVAVAVAVAAAVTSACAAGSRSAAVDIAPPSQVPTSVPSPTSPPTSATLDYIPPAGSTGAHVHKTVAGATYQRLAADLAALTPVPAGNATCNVLNGESATITVTNGHHTKVYVVEGSPCRGVRLTRDGTPQPLLAGSTTLLTQIRAIAGTSGLAHPLGTS